MLLELFSYRLLDDKNAFTRISLHYSTSCIGNEHAKGKITCDVFLNGFNCESSPFTNKRRRFAI